MPATRKQVDANRRNGHMRRAARNYARAAEFLVKAREWRDASQPAAARSLVMVARSYGRAARHALTMAATVGGR